MKPHQSLHLGDSGRPMSLTLELHGHDEPRDPSHEQRAKNHPPDGKQDAEELHRSRTLEEPPLHSSQEDEASDRTRDEHPEPSANDPSIRYWIGRLSSRPTRGRPFGPLPVDPVLNLGNLLRQIAPQSRGRLVRTVDGSNATIGSCRRSLRGRVLRLGRCVRMRLAGVGGATFAAAGSSLR